MISTVSQNSHPPGGARARARFRRHLLMTALLGAALVAGLALVPGPGAAQGPQGRGLIGRHLIFACTYRTTDARGTSNDYVLLGHYDFLNETDVKLTYFSYDARKNLAPGTTRKQHTPMNAPYARGAVDPGFIHIPSYAASEKFTGTWRRHRDALQVRIGGVVHQWRLQDRDSEFFVMTEPYVDAQSGAPIIEGLTYSNGRGYAYLADSVTDQHRITRRQLLDNYKGETYALTGTNRDRRWAQIETGLSTYTLRSAGDEDVWGTSYSGDSPQTPGMWCQTSLLLNYAPYSKQLLYINGGHDYNRNGAFDETGHQKQLFGVLEGRTVTKMVFIESSYENDGYPIVGVGRYYGDERPGPRGEERRPPERR